MSLGSMRKNTVVTILYGDDERRGRIVGLRTIDREHSLQGKGDTS